MPFNLFNFNLTVNEINLNPFNLFRKKLTKETAFILFIDDEHFPIIDNLSKSGWNTKRIKDVKDIKDIDIKRANIIFVDYKGVGKFLAPNEEGIGIIKHLKETYGKSKRVIFYSGYGRFSLGDHLKLADNQMSKESDTYEFIHMIESELKKL